MDKSFSSMAAFLWSVADLLRGDFKQSQYGRVILPFTLLRRLECVLAPTKGEVRAKYGEVKSLPEEAQEKLLLHAYPKAVDDAVIGSMGAHSEQSTGYLSSERLAQEVRALVLAAIKRGL